MQSITRWLDPILVSTQFASLSYVSNLFFYDKYILYLKFTIVYLLDQKNINMKIYSLRLSEDGTHQEVYTNIKAMFSGIQRTGYEPETLTLVDYDEHDLNKYSFQDIKYSYANLAKAIKHSSKNGRYYARVTVYCSNNNCIEIQEHQIVTNNI